MAALELMSENANLADRQAVEQELQEAVETDVAPPVDAQALDKFLR